MQNSLFRGALGEMDLGSCFYVIFIFVSVLTKEKEKNYTELYTSHLRVQTVYCKESIRLLWANFNFFCL